MNISSEKKRWYPRQKVLQGLELMPIDRRPVIFRTSFDEVADDYEAVRPGYPLPSSMIL